MNPGKLDILGTIQTDAGSKNAAGERVSSWTTYKTAWLGKITLNATEPVQADQKIAFTTEEFKCRTTDISGVTNKMRLLISTEVYDIVQIIYLDRMYSKLVCQKKDND